MLSFGPYRHHTYSSWATAITQLEKVRQCHGYYYDMHFSLYIHHRQTMVSWQCCLKGLSEACMWSLSLLKKKNTNQQYSILTSSTPSKIVTTNVFGSSSFLCSLAKLFFAGWSPFTLQVFCPSLLRQKNQFLLPS